MSDFSFIKFLSEGTVPNAEASIGTVTTKRAPKRTINAYTLYRGYKAVLNDDRAFGKHVDSYHVEYYPRFKMVELVLGHRSAPLKGSYGEANLTIEGNKVKVELGGNNGEQGVGYVTFNNDEYQEDPADYIDDLVSDIKRELDALVMKNEAKLGNKI